MLHREEKAAALMHRVKQDGKNVILQELYY